jgi:hypothetical protein
VVRTKGTGTTHPPPHSLTRSLSLYPPALCTCTFFELQERHFFFTFISLMIWRLYMRYLIFDYTVDGVAEKNEHRQFKRHRLPGSHEDQCLMMVRRPAVCVLYVALQNKISFQNSVSGNIVRRAFYLSYYRVQ